MAEVRLSRRAVKDLDAIPAKAAGRVLEALERVGADPMVSATNVKPLVGRKPWRRLRVGDYRALFRVTAGGEILLVARVVDRKELDHAVRTLPD